MSIWPNALMAGGGVLDFLQTYLHNQRVAGYRDEALDFLEQQDTENFGAPTLNELMTSGMFDDQPSLYFNPDNLSREVRGLRTQYGGAMDDAFGQYQSELDDGLADSEAALFQGLGGLRDIRQEGVGTLNRSRIGLGSTFDLLDLDDPEQRYQEALTFGDEAASANQDAALRSEIDNSFAESARLGIDPFEAGAFDDSSRQLANRRYDDLFQSRAAAAGERNRIQEFNVGARQGALESEMATNRNIDSAIQALFAQEMGGATDLYGTRMTGDQTFRTGMLNNLFGRQTNIEGNYIPQIAAMETEIARLTQQGRIDEANRLRENIAQAQGVRMDEVGANQTMIAQQLATILHDPEILAMIQPLLANVFPRFQG